MNILIQLTLQMVDFMYASWLCTFIAPSNYKLLKDKVLLGDNDFPNNFPEAEKMIKRFGVEYISYHACPNDCILNRDADVEKERCLEWWHDRH